jgi:cytochrome P450
VDAPPTVQFDHHSSEFAENWAEELRELRARCPVARTDAHDGYWVLTKAQDVHAAGVNTDAFSSERPAEDLHMMSLTIPRMRYPLAFPTIPAEFDPPASRDYRHFMNTLVSPRAVELLRPSVAKWTTYFLDQIAGRGECDLVTDFTTRVPACVTLEWMGLPLDNWAQFVKAQHDGFVYPPGSPEFIEATRLKALVMQDLVDAVASRRAEPRDDVITKLVQGTAGGVPLTDEEIISMATILVGGGVDTTASLLGSTLVHLGLHPEDRHRLIAEPDLLKSATEEFLRAYCPAMAHARTVVHDTEIGGYTLKAGDRVLLSWMSANYDEEAFEDPEQVVLDRFPNRHYTFGIGTHRCAGSHFARMMFKEALTLFLERIPDYTIVDPSLLKTYPDKSLAFGYSTIPIRFEPQGR